MGCNEGFSVLFKDEATALESLCDMAARSRGHKNVVAEVGCNEED
jgi:hypothetical protein